MIQKVYCRRLRVRFITLVEYLALIGFLAISVAPVSLLAVPIGGNTFVPVILCAGDTFRCIVEKRLCFILLLLNDIS